MDERRRINHQIRISQVMVIDDSGEQLGVMSPEEGRRIADEKGLDLVEVAPGARPPVCKIMDYGRYRYEQRKRTKKQHQIQTKIIKMRPKTDQHDLETKLRHARRFLEGGDRVRFVVRMRGRERAVTERWVAQLNQLIAKLEDIGVATGRPAVEAGGVTTTVEPRKVPQKDNPPAKQQSKPGKPAPAPRPKPDAAAAAPKEQPSAEAPAGTPAEEPAKKEDG